MRDDLIYLCVFAPLREIFILLFSNAQNPKSYQLASCKKLSNLASL